MNCPYRLQRISVLFLFSQQSIEKKPFFIFIRTFREKLKLICSHVSARVTTYKTNMRQGTRCNDVISGYSPGQSFTREFRSKPLKLQFTEVTKSDPFHTRSVSRSCSSGEEVGRMVVINMIGYMKKEHVTWLSFSKRGLHNLFVKRM